MAEDRYMIISVDLEDGKTEVFKSPEKPRGTPVKLTEEHPHGETLRLNENEGPMTLFRTSLRYCWYNGHGYV